MSNKRNICKIDDYIQPTQQTINTHIHPILLSHKLSNQFKLDRIYPKNINIKFHQQQKQNQQLQHQQSFKYSQNIKSFTRTDEKFYQDYMTKDITKQKILVNKKNRICHIFNIKSINLIQKSKYQKERLCIERIHMKQKYSSKQIKRDIQKQRQGYLGLNLILVDKKQTSSPQRIIKKSIGLQKNIGLQRKNSFDGLNNNKNNLQNRSIIGTKNGENNEHKHHLFQNKLQQYYNYIKQHCHTHGLQLQQIQNYPKNYLYFYVGKGNNGMLIKQLVKKRWWWNINDDRTKKQSNFIWTQLKQKQFYQKRQKITRQKSVKSYSRSKTQSQVYESLNILPQKILNLDTTIHNHFQNNQFLGNKKALFYNMKEYYEKQGKNVFDYLPLTFHVKRYNDSVWQQFTRYYFQDLKNNGEGCRLWIVKPGQNTNRGTGITIYSEYNKIKQWVQSQISGDNNPKKTFIIQKYIDKPFLYYKRKFDIRCYMLLVRLNGKIKGYWYNQGYIRTSCFEFQLNNTQNQFIHLTNDAIQVNSEKYGKYQDGNKLSYNNFQKYLTNIKSSHNFYQEICPQLKKIGTDSIEATYHLLGKWDGKPTFEIFGLDFMIDQNLKPWLIQINTNPCLQTSSVTLQRIIPRMVDNAFKLSIDLMFPPPLNWQNSKKHYLPNNVSKNLFEIVFDEEKQMDLHTGSKDIILEMGQIDEDNQVYEENNVDLKKSDIKQ